VRDDIEVLIPDPVVAKEFGISLMSMWRWDRDEAKIALGWPPKVQLRKRNYRHRSQIEAFKANLLKRALAKRDDLSAA